MSSILETQITKRRTFAIISHPDAGKTTITEKLLLYGCAIQLAGSIKAKKAGKHATSDWMELEKERGISVTTSVMQFLYNNKIVNLLDTPGHEDFSEDTYRTLTAVDSALMVIDVAKGVEDRTKKLMEICRMRTTPIFTFINKIDRHGKDCLELLDEIETVLNIKCAPVTWPIGQADTLKGLYQIYKDEIILFKNIKQDALYEPIIIKGIDSKEAQDNIDNAVLNNLKEEIELVKGASHELDLDEYMSGRLTPVFFGTALKNFGVRELLDIFTEYAPAPSEYDTDTRKVNALEGNFSGFVFKIQANMDPKHRDRIAFLKVCSGSLNRGDKVHQVRINKDIAIANPITFMAQGREITEAAYAGDIVGLHNHGTIQIGDTFTKGEKLNFTGIPHFAPELFKKVRTKDPLKLKALIKGLVQLSEEGATQVFRPFISNDIILGAVGVLQFDVVAHRLKFEYGVECIYEPVSVYTVRWITPKDSKNLKEFNNFKSRQEINLALDASGDLVYIAPSRVNLHLTEEKWPDVVFSDTKDIV